METLFASLLNWKTTILAILVFVAGVLPEVGNLVNSLIEVFQGNIFAIMTAKTALLSLVTAFGLFFAKDATTGSLPKE